MKKFLAAILMVMMAFCGANAENLIIMGWDGAGWNNVGPMLAAGDLPNLQNLIDNGGEVVPIKSFGRTVTGAQWPQYLTGLDYDQSGVLGNNQLSTPLNTNFDAANYIYLGAMGFWIETIAYERFFFDDLDASYHIGVFVSKQDPMEHINTPLAANVTAYRKVEPSACPDTAYLNTLVTRAKGFMANRTDHVVFLHANPDYCGHRVGENGADYLNAIVDADDALGELVAAAASGTKFVVMADHGFDEGSTQHKNATDMWMVTNLPVQMDYVLPASGVQRAFANARDLMPTILDHYGFDWQSRLPKLRGKSLVE